MIDAPFEELDYSSDYLDEFHGFTDEDDNGDGFNQPITANNYNDEEGADFLEDGIPMRTRNGDLLIGETGEELKDDGEWINEEEVKVQSH
jgi:hypothetical protein